MADHDGDHESPQEWGQVPDVDNTKEHHGENIQQANDSHAANCTQNAGVSVPLEQAEMDAKKLAMRINAKENRIASLEASLRTTKDEIAVLSMKVIVSQGLLDAAEIRRAATAAEASKAKAAVQALLDAAPQYDADIAAAKANTSRLLDKFRPKFAQWVEEFHRDACNSLIYPIPGNPFDGNEDDEDIDIESEAGSQQLSTPAKTDDAVLESSGMIQRLNNPMYLTDRNFSRGTLCLMMNRDYTKVVDVAEQALSGISLANRADDLVTSGKANNHLAARDLVALEVVKEGKNIPSVRSHVGLTDVKMMEKILAKASTGRILKEVVKAYGDGVLAVLPIAEFLKFTRTQQMDNVPTDKLSALVDLVNPRLHAQLAKFLHGIVALLDKYLDYSSSKICLKAYGADVGKMFEADIGAFRQQLNLPTTSASPLSEFIDIEPAALWELLASTSGFDINTDQALGWKDFAKSGFVIRDPRVVLGEAFGRHYVFNEDGVVFNDTGFGIDTMRFAIQLFTTNDSSIHQSATLFTDGREGKVVDVEAAMSGENEGRSLLCFVLTKKGWVFVLVQKDGNGEQQLMEAYVIAHVEQDTHPDEQPGAMAVAALSLENVELVPVHVPQPQEHASGIHAFCHWLAFQHCGYYWIGNLDDSCVREIRHMLLRRITATFVDTVNHEETEKWME
ncbi:hypothetical protein Daus18300_008068 [Diaporthe australafricana]|uniref:Uncharacterized protein n=1 Tax=Diaporthe australafricana TaxID=127596 RepID=A0ABR3WJT4_9PEZI